MVLYVNKLFKSCLRIQDSSPLRQPLLLPSAFDNGGALPDDVLAMVIAQFTRKQDAVAMRLVCKSWRDLVDETILRIAVHSSAPRPLATPPHLPHLNHLSIDHCTALTVQNLMPLVMACTALVCLQLSDSPLGKLPSNLCNLPGLESLIAMNCNLSSLPSRLHMLPKLKLLNVSNNLLPELPSAIGSIPTLVKLDISNNHLASIPESINGCHSLVHLNASCNLLTELPDGLEDLEQLSNLNLNYNRIKTLPLHFTRLQSLSVLACHAGFSHSPKNEEDTMIKALAQMQLRSPKLRLVADEVVSALVRRRARRLRRAAEQQAEAEADAAFGVPAVV